MKTTYLVNQKQADGGIKLMVVSSAEWLNVVKANKQLPPDQRKHFILDYIADGDELDRMVIGVPAADYHIWHREHMASVRNRKKGQNFQVISFETLVFGDDEPERLSDSIMSSDQVEEKACSQLLILSLRKDLSAWRPWGNDLLDLLAQLL